MTEEGYISFTLQSINLFDQYIFILRLSSPFNCLLLVNETADVENLIYKPISAYST